MKALTLWQPWATLVALGEKGIETRAWGTNYRGPLAIHASVNQRPAREMWEEDVFRKILLGHSLNPDNLPYGGVVAIVTLDELVRTVDLADSPRVSQKERAFGDFNYGRWAWFLKHPKRLWRPCAGSRGLWEWDGRPADVSP